MKKQTETMRQSLSGAMRKFIAVAFSLVISLAAIAQTRNVSGVVVDDSGEPLIGATVLVKGTKFAVATDIDGKFTIQASPKQSLTVTYIGYYPKEVKADKTNLQIVLEENAQTLDEVVVVGYGTARKETLTGAVSAIDNKELAITKTENVVNMLAGKLPGVRVQQNTSQPGEFAADIDIRGMGSPLIVIDGIPRDQAYFSRMDANEIEQVSVLKDASAAIYGVRAANGVILVTTKHGSANKNGKVDVTFQANYGIQNFAYVPTPSDVVTHMRIYNERSRNNIGLSYPSFAVPTYSEEDIAVYANGEKKATNWYEETFRHNIPSQQYNVSVNGGSDRINYFFNVGYNKQDGSFKSRSLNYDRWNFRTNIDAKITDHLKATAMVSGYIDEYNAPTGAVWNVYKYSWVYRPTAEAYIDGDHNYPAYDKEFSQTYSPVSISNSDLVGYKQKKHRDFEGQLTLTYELPWVKGLQAKASYYYNYATDDNTTVYRTYYLYEKTPDGDLIKYTRQEDNPSVTRATAPMHNTLLNLSVSYNNRFGDHTIGALALYEETYNTWTDFMAQRAMLLDSEYLILGEEDGQIGKSQSLGDISRRAWIGKVDYDYKGKYLANLAFRYDASSRYPKDGRWGFFPSVALGWRISEESFLKDRAGEWLNNLKLRGSWGKLGDDAAAHTYPSTFVGFENHQWYSWYFDDMQYIGVNPTAVPNPHWTWYTAETWNLGLDWDTMNQRFGGTVEFFVRNRHGLPATSDLVLPNVVGATMPQENKESDRTFGWEIQLTHHNRIGNVNYFVNGQISATKTRWTEVLRQEYRTSMEEWRSSGKQAGRNTNIWWSIEEGGRYQNWNQIAHSEIPVANGALPGDYYYKDWNGDGFIDGNDSHPMVTSGMPIFYYGINMGASWKGLDFSMNWQGAARCYGSYNEVFSVVAAFDGAVLKQYEDRWHTANLDDDPWNPNTQWIEGYYPATGHSFDSYQTGIRNKSYLRLKTLEIGYTFPHKWMKPAGIKDLRVYINGYNLLTLSGLKNIDPERPTGLNAGGLNQYSYPVSKIWNFGINVKF